MSGKTLTRSGPAAIRARLGDDSGFTLVETLAAAIILAIGILGTVTVFSSADSTTVDAELQQIATDQGERAIEQIRSLDYSQIGHTTAPALPAGESGLSGNTYQSPDSGSAEQLVTAANTESGDPKYAAAACGSEDTSGAASSTATSCFRIGTAAYPQDQTFTVTQAGGRTVTGHIYTMVTWRDEECELLPIGSLKTQLNNLGTILDNRIGQLNNVTTGILSSTTYGLNSLLNGVLPIWAQHLKDSAFTSGGQLASATGLLSLLQQTRTTLNSLNSSLSGLTSLDLCDIRLAQFKSLTAVTQVDGSGNLQLDSSITTPLGTTSSSGTLGTNIAAVQSALSSFKGALGILTTLTCPNALLPALCGYYNTLNTVSQTLSTSIGGAAGIYANTNTLRTDLANLASLSAANTTHNTKRVTVAVTIDRGSREDLTPANVVYLSSVVVDPNEGLLG